MTRVSSEVPVTTHMGRTMTTAMRTSKSCSFSLSLSLRLLVGVCCTYTQPVRRVSRASCPPVSRRGALERATSASSRRPLRKSSNLKLEQNARTKLFLAILRSVSFRVPRIPSPPLGRGFPCFCECYTHLVHVPRYFGEEDLFLYFDVRAKEYFSFPTHSAHIYMEAPR